MLKLYGGWVEIVDEDGNGTGEYGYGDANKPYTAFQDTLNIRWEAETTLKEIIQDSNMLFIFQIGLFHR